MALKIESVGAQTAPLSFSYSWRDVVLYALGVGARLPGELDFLWEGRGPRVLPTYAVIPAYPAVAALFDAVGGDYLGVVHGGQSIRLHRPFPPESTLTTIGRVAGIYDLKRLAIAVFSTETRDASGALLSETEWQILYRFDGGFGGPPPPKRDDVRPPKRNPDWTVTLTTTREQAALYRLSGDLNPLHIDPAVGEKAGFGGPILHGLCTYGFVARAVIAQEASEGGSPDPTRLRALSGSFKKPVWPGDALVVDGFREEGRVLLRAARAIEPDEPVFTGAARLGAA
jgi:acyl dehydratase